MKKVFFNDDLIEKILSRSLTHFINICKSNYLNRSYHQFQIFKNLKCYSDLEAVFYWADTNGNKVLEKPTYKPGTEVAIAQPYSSIIIYVQHDVLSTTLLQSKGWDNKMFVEADLMPHRIKILNVRLQKLQDCSDNRAFVNENIWNENPYMFLYEFELIK